MKIIPFLKVAGRDLRIGALMPSSKHAVKKIMKQVPSGVRTVLEYGPGDGVITRRLLDCLPEDGRLVAIEQNEAMCDEVRAISDPRLVLIRGDATKAIEHIRDLGIERFDLIVSGIPFSMVPSQVRHYTAEMTHGLLKSGGIFLVYQTSPLMVPYLKKRFEVKTALELRNVPPYFIMRAEKREKKCVVRGA